jgi:hypothetical protein
MPELQPKVVAREPTVKENKSDEKSKKKEEKSKKKYETKGQAKLSFLFALRSLKKDFFSRLVV